jgi:DNA-binding HxlR family transcriptional regulator
LQSKGLADKIRARALTTPWPFSFRCAAKPPAKPPKGDPPTAFLRTTAVSENTQPSEKFKTSENESAPFGYGRKITRPYSNIPSELIKDASLSAEARFVYVWLMDLPEGWRCRIPHMVKAIPISRDRLYRCLKELTNAGWVQREDYRDPRNGRVCGTNYFAVDVRLTEDEHHFLKIRKRISRTPTHYRGYTDTPKKEKPSTLTVEDRALPKRVGDTREVGSGPAQPTLQFFRCVSCNWDGFVPSELKTVFCPRCAARQRVTQAPKPKGR